jgi:hypothetical protein
MTRLKTLQFLGPVALFSAVLTAEMATYALAHAPSSEWLWYVNLKWFSMFQQSHYSLKDHLGVDCEQFFCVALPLFSAACVGLAFKRSLILAISSNLSFVYIGFVVYTWFRANSYSQEASLSVHYVASSDPDLILLLALVGLSLVSFVVSHVAYFQKVRARA